MKPARRCKPLLEWATLGCVIGLAGCTITPKTHPAVQDAPPPPVIEVGGDSDEHGCKASAGYSWCAHENACIRPWELARQHNLNATPQAIEQYCSAADAKEP
jgi:hypothetical protein